jgi:hypothetical protein
MKRRFASGLVCAALAACDSSPPVQQQPDLPPRICKAAAPPSFPWFADATSDFGLSPKVCKDACSPSADQFVPVATTVVSADLDGDGWPDLIASQGDSHRDFPSRVRFLLMNRSDPNDPTRRIFVDVPDLAGLRATRDGQNNRNASMAVLGDLDNDGDVDAITCPSDFTTNDNMLDGCAAFLNDGTAHFTLAPQSDLDAKVYPATSAMLFDFDGDGVLDFFQAGMAHWPYGGTGGAWHFGPKLCRGDGTFTDVSAQMGLPTHDPPASQTVVSGTSYDLRHTFGVTHCDLDGDGDQDILTASYGRQENWVFRNDGDHFTEVGGDLGLSHDDREDYSDDQSFRCYCAATKDPKACNPMPPLPSVQCNAFGGPYFRGWYPGVTDQHYSLGGNNFGVTCTDVDDDGDMDVVYATVVHGDVGSSSDPTELILNPGDGTKFTRPGNDVTGLKRPDEIGVYWNHGDNMPVFIDADLDGRKDFYLTATSYTADRPWFWHQKDDGTFEEVGIPSGLVTQNKKFFWPVAQGVDFIDVDGDGDLDLVIGSAPDTYDTNDPSKVGVSTVYAFRNTVGQDSNFIRIKLVGLGAGHSNVSAIGARVRVTAGGRTQTQEVKGGEGIGAIQNDFVLTFGLGAACDVDSIEVRWPDAAATTTTYTNVRANYAVTIHEGDASPTYASVDHSGT